MSGFAVARGRYDPQVVRSVSGWAGDYLRKATLTHLACAVLGVLAMVQLRFGNDVTGIYIALGLALPVLWLLNVFLGDRSLVGPQPALADEAAKHADHVRRRLVVKSGLTGLWLARGRSELSLEESLPLHLIRTTSSDTAPLLT